MSLTIARKHDKDWYLFETQKSNRTETTTRCLLPEPLILPEEVQWRQILPILLPSHIYLLDSFFFAQASLHIAVDDT